MGRMQKSLLERFEEKYSPEPNSGCWLWIGCIGGQDERATIWCNGTMAYAYRVSWELYRGKVPDGMQVLHHCDVPSCVNPDHLFVGTQSDNMQDCAKKKRVAPNPLLGEDSNLAKLSADDVREIRTKALPYQRYMEKFDINQTTVHQIQRRATWKHIP